VTVAQARPPVESPHGPLTIDDLRLVHDWLGADEEDFLANLYDRIILAQTRLRCAIEEADRA